MAFWKLIEPASHNMIHVSRATTMKSEAGTADSPGVNKKILILHFQWKSSLHITCT